jgi:hypothetical protein
MEVDDEPVISSIISSKASPPKPELQESLTLLDVNQEASKLKNKTKGKSSRKTLDTITGTLNAQRVKFHDKLISLFDAQDPNAYKSLANNDIWVVNHQIVPIGSYASSQLSCGYMKLKYLTPENDHTVYNYVLKNANAHLFDVYGDENGQDAMQVDGYLILVLF